MRNYKNITFDKITHELIRQNNLEVHFKDKDVLRLRYFLTREFYYAAIIDDYIIEINDKENLLEALYYQLRLITVHALNWDAICEGMLDALNQFTEGKGLCLIFRHGTKLREKIPIQYKELVELVNSINVASERNQIKIIINAD